jgi:hypothetical protein
MFEALFGTEMPLALRFLLALVVLVAILALAIFVLVRFRISIRRLIIRTSELLALLAILLSTLASGVTSASWAGMQARLSDAPEGLYVVIGFALGALSGFVASAIVLAIWFLLIEIAENTRKTVGFFEHLSSRKQA